MKRLFILINSFLKGAVLFFRPGYFFNFLSSPFLFIANLLRLTKWISGQKNKNILNDFYVPFRDYEKRYKLYEYLVKSEKLEDEEIDFLEFGVAEAYSFKWWLKSNKNPGSKFYGFDTFEGLPENWGTFKKGDMSVSIPDINDGREEFIKGLFQESLYKFIDTHNLQNGKRKIIHLDADLFSSTLFVMTTLAKFLNEGDIIIFDEFNVPNHEFFAFKCFTDSFYVKLELIAAVNNYFQAAFKVIK